MRRRKERGATIWEVFIVMGLMVIFIPVIWNFMKTFETKKKIEVTKERIKALEKAVKVMYVSNVKFAESNCYGWSDPLCRGMTVTPYPSGGNPTTAIVMRTNNDAVYSVLREIGCDVRGGVVRCQDGWGDWMVFTLSNYHLPGSSYTAPYRGQFFSMVIRYRYGTVVLDISREIEWSIALTSAKLSEIATAVKRFTRNIRLRELTNVCNTVGTSPSDPSGGLRSWDDAMVPWVWKVVSERNVLCSGAETTAGCGCTNHNNLSVWETRNAWRVVNTASEWNRVLFNLNLPLAYRVDGFGNALTFVPLSDRNGNPLSVPPRPRPNYPLSGVWKSRVGVLQNGVWFVYYDIVSE